MTPVSDSALDSLHTTSTAIFTGALEACNIESAFDRRIRFDGNTLVRLLPDGSGPDTINLSGYRRIVVIAHGQGRRAHARCPSRSHEAPQGSARHLLLKVLAQKAQLAFSLF